MLYVVNKKERMNFLYKVLIHKTTYIDLSYSFIHINIYSIRGLENYSILNLDFRALSSRECLPAKTSYSIGSTIKSFAFSS